MAAQINIQFKESTLDTLIRSTEGLMKSTSFFLPVNGSLPLIDIARRRNICGWEVTKLPGLLFKAKKGDVTLRYYYVTKEWVVNFDDTNRQFEFEHSAHAKQLIRKWFYERERTVHSGA